MPSPLFNTAPARSTVAQFDRPALDAGADHRVSGGELRGRRAHHGPRAERGASAELCDRSGHGSRACSQARSRSLVAVRVRKGLVEATSKIRETVTYRA